MIDIFDLSTFSPHSWAYLFLVELVCFDARLQDPDHLLDLYMIGFIFTHLLFAAIFSIYFFLFRQILF